MNLINLPPTLQLIKDARVFNYAKLELFSGLPKGAISSAINGSRPLTETQLRKLESFLELTRILPIGQKIP